METGGVAEGLAVLADSALRHEFAAGFTVLHWPRAISRGNEAAERAVAFAARPAVHGVGEVWAVTGSAVA